MPDLSTQQAIQQLIDDEVQESLSLEYKSADALGKGDSKKISEITKDVSAMANSSGGIILYGVKEFAENTGKRYLPEKIDPVNQAEYSKEWLEQVISNVRPRIQNLKILPVPIEGVPHGVVYIVEVPQSTTAHQARDWRYYKRYNFENVPMEDYEIRDVMNRGTTPNPEVEFGLFRVVYEYNELPSCRRLKVVVKNESNLVINKFKLILRLKNVGISEESGWGVTDLFESDDDKTYSYSYLEGEHGNLDVQMVYQSNEVLFPNEAIDLGGHRIKYAFFDSLEKTNDQWIEDAEKGVWILDWTLYPDNMAPKRGSIPIFELAKVS